MKPFIFVIPILVFIISACSPSESTIQTAIAQTQKAQATLTPSITPSPLPTSTPTHTETLTITPTQTPTITPTPDIRIIDTSPRLMLCKDEDLPKEGLYYIPDQSWMSINTNEEVISYRGVEKGRDYVIKTGRVTGWWVARARGTRAVRMPDEIDCGVFTFKTAEGATLALRKYNSVESYPMENWKYVDKKIDLGMDYIVQIKQKVDSAGNRNKDFDIDFTYRNLLIYVEGIASKEEDVPDELIENIAKKMLTKIKQEPLISPEDAILAK